MHGWLPLTVQAVAGTVLLVTIARRNRRWQRMWLPVCAAVGLALTAAAYWYVQSEGLSGGEPAPIILWLWIAATGAAAVVLVLGWRGARWWRRGVSILGVPLSLLCATLALNLWVGYFPTVQAAWNDLTAGPLPDQTYEAAVVAMQRIGGEFNTPADWLRAGNAIKTLDDFAAAHHGSARVRPTGASSAGRWVAHVRST